MHAIIVGCGRVGSELTIQLGRAGHEVAIIDKRPSAFDRLPPDFKARTIVGLGFDRDILEEAGIKDADAFIAVTNGDNSNIVSARVAREHYHVPKVIARIYDPRRAEIYERLNIPTVATTTWGVKQVMLMLAHPREEIKESLAGGDLFRMRLQVPEHLVGTPIRELNLDGKTCVVGVDRGGHGFIPVADSTFQEGDFAALIVHKDALAELDELLTPVAEQ
ncbi:MAG TPA: TrkA family potassium uptake protein [Actinomycetota bacterium]|jgi:trk system potassium uptake protein TrkA|nr:TrkA family potassium uptake protein [Actinomycetota bacterium]